MPDTKFLERLHADPSAVEPELLPDSLRPSYDALLDACAAARDVVVDPSAAARIRPRTAIPWLLIGALAAAATLSVVFVHRSDDAKSENRAERSLPSDLARSGEEREPDRVRPQSGADTKAMHVAAADELRITMRDSLDALQRLDRTQIAVLEGDFDRVEAVLDLYDIPYTRVQGSADRLAFWERETRLRRVLLRIQGEVKNVQADAGVVEINLGPDNGVRVDDVFSVHRGEKRIGTIRILWVEKTGSTGGFDPRFTDARPQVGDRVRPVDPDPALEAFTPGAVGRVFFVNRQRASISLGAADGVAVGARFKLDGGEATVIRVSRVTCVAEVVGRVREGDGATLVPAARVELRARAKVVIVPSSRPPPQAERLRVATGARAFVEGGGWLFTTDRAFHAYVFDAFPSRAEVVPRGRLGPVVPVRAVAASPFVAGLAGRNRDVRWGLGENTFVSLFPDAGRVLLMTGDHDLAFEFRQGLGRVVHLVGHTYLRAGSYEGFVAAHRFLLNSLLARFEN